LLEKDRKLTPPDQLFNALFVGYLFGIRSERQLMREIEVNVAYRWFIGQRLTDGVFDASTLSLNRCRRFGGADIAQRIFDHVVEHAIAKGLEERGIPGVTGYLRPSGPRGMLRKRALDYDVEADVYRCPDGQVIPYATTDRGRLSALQIRPLHVPGLPAAGIVRHQCKGAKDRHPTRLGRRPREGGCTSSDRLGQEALLEPKSNRRAILRGRQTALRPSLCMVQKSRKGPNPMPARRTRPEHQQDRNGFVEYRPLTQLSQ